MVESLKQIVSNLRILLDDGEIRDQDSLKQVMESNEPVASYLLVIGAMLDAPPFKRSALGQVLVDLTRDELPELDDFMVGMGGV